MSGLPNAQQNNEQILNDIQSLQQMEQQLFNSLETNTNLSTDEQQKIVEKMNQLSNMRINLYQTLSGVNNYFENALNTSVGSLKQQLVAIEIVENELDKAKRRLEILEEEKNNKIRLVQINTYYGDKYAEHAQLMKIIIFTLIPVIIVSFIFNAGFLPSKIYYIILIIISLIGAYFFWIRFASIIMRDNMNYQEYNWSFNPNNISTSSSTTSDPWQTNINLNIGTCVGDYCCAADTAYDSTLNQCVPSPGAPGNSFSADLKSSGSSFYQSIGGQGPEGFEGMVNHILTKSQVNKNGRSDVDLREPQPSNM
jgi:hypothetical protein